MSSKRWCFLVTLITLISELGVAQEIVITTDRDTIVAPVHLFSTDYFEREILPFDSCTIVVMNETRYLCTYLDSIAGLTTGNLIVLMGETNCLTAYSPPSTKRLLWLVTDSTENTKTSRPNYAYLSDTSYMNSIGISYDAFKQLYALRGGKKMLSVQLRSAALFLDSTKYDPEIIVTNTTSFRAFAAPGYLRSATTYSSISPHVCADVDAESVNQRAFGFDPRVELRRSIFRYATFYHTFHPRNPDFPDGVVSGRICAGTRGDQDKINYIAEDSIPIDVTFDYWAVDTLASCTVSGLQLDTIRFSDSSTVVVDQAANTIFPVGKPFYGFYAGKLLRPDSLTWYSAFDGGQNYFYVSDEKSCRKFEERYGRRVSVATATPPVEAQFSRSATATTGVVCSLHPHAQVRIDNLTTGLSHPHIHEVPQFQPILLSCEAGHASKQQFFPE